MVYIRSKKQKGKIYYYIVEGKKDKEGKVKFPGSIRRAAGLKEGQLVELKITGASKRKHSGFSKK